MNTTLLEIINDIEKKNNSDRDLSIKKIILRNYKSKINKLLMRIISFLRLPQYYLPKKHISEELLAAQKNILINFEPKKNLSNYDIEIEKVLAKIDLRYKYSQLLLLSTLVKQVVEDKSQ